MKIDLFFEDNNMTINKLKQTLLKYENNNDEKNSNINSAMKEYLNILNWYKERRWSGNIF